MKFARITLSATAVIVSIVSAFAFTNSSSKGTAGTLYTIGGNQHVKCSRNLPGHNSCPVLAYTKNHTLVTAAFSTGD